MPNNGPDQQASQVNTSDADQREGDENAVVAVCDQSHGMSMFHLLKSRLRSVLTNSIEKRDEERDCGQRYEEATTSHSDNDDSTRIPFRNVQSNRTSQNEMLLPFAPKENNYNEPISSPVKTNNIDQSIIDKIVSRAVSPSIPMIQQIANSANNNRTNGPSTTVAVATTVRDPRMKPQPTAGNQFHINQIADPRIRKMLNSQTQLPSADQAPNTGFENPIPHHGFPPNAPPYMVMMPRAAGPANMFQMPTVPRINSFGSFGSQAYGAPLPPPPPRQSSGKKSAPITYGEYKRQRLGGAGPNGGGIAVKLPAIRKEIAKPKEVSVGKTRMKELPERRRSDNFIVSPEPSKIDSSDSQSIVRAMENNVPKNPSPLGNLVTNQNAIDTFKDLINSHNLRTLVDFMKRVSENNPAAQGEGTTAAATTSGVETTAATETTVALAANAIDSATIDGTKKAKKRNKNELDRLHEDIDNMWMRDGVLNARGRRRSGKLHAVEPTYDDGMFCA